MSGGLPSWARKGVKVVCVAKVIPQQCVEPGPRVYTISSAFFCVNHWHITLAELPQNGGELVSSFRPLVSTKTEDEDLAHFRPYLHQNAPEGIDA